MTVFNYFFFQCISLRTLTEGQAFIYNKGSPDGEPVIFSWLIERCMLDALEGVDAVCPRHGSISPIYLMGREGVTHQLFLAPDTVSLFFLVD